MINECLFLLWRTLLALGFHIGLTDDHAEERIKYMRLASKYVLFTMYNKVGTHLSLKCLVITNSVHIIQLFFLANDEELNQYLEMFV